MTSLFSKQKESVFAPFLRRCKDAGSTFKTTLPPVTLKDPFSPGRAHAPARVTLAVMTPTLSSGTCPLRLHLLLLPLVPDSCRDPLPASASFRPPLREAERSHALHQTFPKSSLFFRGNHTPHPTSAPSTHPAGSLDLLRSDTPSLFIPTSGMPLLQASAQKI